VPDVESGCRSLDDADRSAVLKRCMMLDDLSLSSVKKGERHLAPSSIHDPNHSPPIPYVRVRIHP
jgi:hypothetical protein